MSRMHRIVLNQHSQRSCVSRDSVQGHFVYSNMTCISLLEATFFVMNGNVMLCYLLIIFFLRAVFAIKVLSM